MEEVEEEEEEEGRKWRKRRFWKRKRWRRKRSMRRRRTNKAKRDKDGENGGNGITGRPQRSGQVQIFPWQNQLRKFSKRCLDNGELCLIQGPPGL